MTRSLARIVVLVFVFVTIASGIRPSPTSQERIARAEERPNVLLIVTDDQRWDSMDFMPRTKARIFDQGVTFTNAFATTPLCCPSRASIFTGMYSGRHGVELNSDKLNENYDTFVKGMNESGYYTGLVGIKYLNTWSPRQPRAEFDFWSVGYYANADTGAGSLNVNGTDIAVNGYKTHVYGDYAQRFLEEAHDQPDPFMLTFAPNAPHVPAIPAPGDENLYLDLPLHRPPSFNEEHVGDKPKWVRSNPLLTNNQIRTIDETRLGQLQMLNSLDIVIDDMLTTLEHQGELDNTIVMFMSDNGYLWGEHRLWTKFRPYDESVRIPMAIRYPALVPAARVDDRIVANIDIAPTMYEIAGLPIPSIVDGQSLIPLLRDDPGLEWRDDILLEAVEFSYNAVHTGDMVYIENSGDIAELYDLTIDPYQLSNRIDNPRYADVVTDMIARLDRLKPRDVRMAGRNINDATYNVRYAGWLGVNDDNAITEGMRTANTGSIRVRTPVTTSVGTLFYRGPNQGKAQIIIDGTDHGVIDLYAPAPDYEYRFDVTGLSNAPHTVTVKALGQKSTVSTGKAVTFDAFIVDTGIIDDWDPRLNYSGWFVRDHPEAFMGSYYTTSNRGVSASFKSIGTSATWITARGPDLGIADVYIDGKFQMSVDLYSPTPEWKYMVDITGINWGRHTVTIRVTGTRNQYSTGTSIVFDGYRLP